MEMSIQQYLNCFRKRSFRFHSTQMKKLFSIFGIFGIFGISEKLTKQK